MADNIIQEQLISSPPSRKITVAVADSTSHKSSLACDGAQDRPVLTAIDASQTPPSSSWEVRDDAGTVVDEACARSSANEASTRMNAVPPTLTPPTAALASDANGCPVMPTCSVSCVTDETSTVTSSTDQRPRRPTRAFARTPSVACEAERAGSSVSALPPHVVDAASLATAAPAVQDAYLDKDKAMTINTALAASKTTPQAVQELLEATDTTYSATIPQCLYTRYMNTELAGSLVVPEAQLSAACDATATTTTAGRTPADEAAAAAEGIAPHEGEEAVQQECGQIVSGVAHKFLSSVSSLHELLMDGPQASFLVHVGAVAAVAAEGDEDEAAGPELQDAIGLTTSLHNSAQACDGTVQESSRRSNCSAQMTPVAAAGMPRALDVFHAPSLPRQSDAAWTGAVVGYGDATEGRPQREAVTRLESLSHVQRVIEDERVGVADRTPSRLLRRRLKRTGKHHHHHRVPQRSAAKSLGVSGAEVAPAAEPQERHKSHHGHRHRRRRRRRRRPQQQTSGSGRSGAATPSQPRPTPPSMPRPASSPRQTSLAGAWPPGLRDAPGTVLVPHPPPSAQPARLLVAKEDDAAAAAAAMAGSALVAVQQLRQARPTPVSPRARRRSNVSLVSVGSQPRSVASHREVVPCEIEAEVAAPAASGESRHRAEEKAAAQPTSRRPRRGQRRHHPDRVHNADDRHSHHRYSDERPLHSSPRSRHVRHSRGRRRNSGASHCSTQGERSHSAMLCPPLPRSRQVSDHCSASSARSPSAVSRLTSTTTSRSCSGTVTTSHTASSSYTPSSSLSPSSSSSSSSSSPSSSSSSASSAHVADLPLKAGCTVPPPPEVFVDLTCRLRCLNELQRYAELACIYEWDVTWGVWDRVETYVVLGNAAFAKGNMRASYYMIDLKRPTCRLVAKRYLKASVEEGQYFDDAAMYAIAGHWARLFNSLQPPKCVKFVPAAVLQLPNRVPPLTLAMEPLLEGTFRKYNNNYGYVPRDVRWTPQAFSHFTYHASHHELMITDIQGVGDIYTDPQILSADGEGYGKGNLGCSGMRRFIRSHRCNPVCQALHLPTPTMPHTRRQSYSTHRPPHHGRHASRRLQNKPHRHHHEGSCSASRAKPYDSIAGWPPAATAVPVEQEAASDGEEPYLFPAKLCAERLPPKLYQRHHLKWTTNRTGLGPGETPGMTTPPPPSLRVALAAEKAAMTTTTPSLAPASAERQKSLGADAVAHVDTSRETTHAGMTGSSVTGNGSVGTTARTTSASPQPTLGPRPGPILGGHATAPFLRPHPPTAPYATGHLSVIPPPVANASVRGPASSAMVYDLRFVPPQLRQTAAVRTPVSCAAPTSAIVGATPTTDRTPPSTMAAAAAAANCGVLPLGGPASAVPQHAAQHPGSHPDVPTVTNQLPAQHEAEKVGVCATHPPATQLPLLPRVNAVHPPGVPVFSAIEVHPPRRRS